MNFLLLLMLALVAALVARGALLLALRLAGLRVLRSWVAHRSFSRRLGVHGFLQVNRRAWMFCKIPSAIMVLSTNEPP